MSLRLRLLAAFAYVLLVVIVALMVPLALNLSRRVNAEVKAEAAGEAQLVASSAADRLGRPRELERLARRAARDVGGRVIIVSSHGRLVADSAGPGLQEASYADRPEVRTALRGRAAQGERFSNSLNEQLLFTAVPVIRLGRPVGVVRVTQSVDAVKSTVRRDTIALIGVGAIALLFGLGVAWLIAGSLTRPLRALARAARRIGAGDLTTRAAASGSSEQRDVAIAFNEMTDRLTQSLAAQREFVANASHQLRTPLTGLRLRLEAAAIKADDPGLHRDLAAGELEAERLARTLDELLTLAREGQRPATGALLDLGDAAAGAQARWQDVADRAGCRLALRGDPDTEVRATKEDLAMLLDNLIENAINYSPAGTTMTLEWGRDGKDSYIAVLDEGPGLAPEEQDRVFERFFRGRSSKGQSGTGLGLAIVRMIARRWGGDAQLASRPTGGTRAEIRFGPGRRGDEASLPKLDPELREA